MRRSQKQYLAIGFMIQSVMMLAVHNSALFEAVAEVWAWHRIANLRLAYCRQVLKLPLMKYVDDFFSVTVDGATSCIEFVAIVAAAMGLPLDDRKTCLLQASMVLLGARLTVSWMRRSVTICLEEEKAHRWSMELLQAVLTGFLDAGAASKLVGQLQFGASMASNRVGRAWLKALHAQAPQAS